MFAMGVSGRRAYLGTLSDWVSKNSWLSFSRTEKCQVGIFWVIASGPGVVVKILLLINLATLWYTVLKMKAGSNTWLRRLDICCFWNPPASRTFENSWGFLIVMSTVPFALDLNEIGLPLTDKSWVLLFVMRPRSEKLTWVFAWRSPFQYFGVG